MRPVRYAPPFWRHDAYTLRLLAKAVRSAARVALTGAAKGGGETNVIDLGAGSAPYRSLFEELGANYVSCDIDVDTDSGTIRIDPGLPVALPENHAKAVVSFQVLEHVWDIDWYLREAARLLKEDGTLIISTHGTWLYHPHPTDYRRWTRDGLVMEIESRGFRVDAVVPIVGPLAWTTQFRTLGYHAILHKLPLIGSVASAILCSVMYLRMKIEDAVTPKEWIDTNASVYMVLASKIAPKSAEEVSK